jgi:hypothetical protein
MKTPKYSDLHKYPHGYKPANQTDVKATFARVIEQQRLAAKERLEKCIELKRKTK